MNVEGQHNPKDVECIPVESLEVLPSGADWQSRHLESERRKAEIRDRIHKQAEQGQKTAKDYFRPAKPTPSIYDSDLKRVAVYARVSTSSEEQISSIENQTLYYTKKIAETENWNLQDIYSDEGKSGTSLRKRDAFKRMMRDAKDQKMDLIICASISRFARNFSDCMTQISALKTMHPAHPIGVYFETENIYTLNPNSQYNLDIQALLADWESGNKSRRMILSYDQRIMTGQYQRWTVGN
jgi:site-specific DNA recombinase